MKTIMPAATALACMLLASPAAAQSVTGLDGRNSPASVRCSALAELEENARAGAVLFLAGYGSGQRDAVNFATSGPSDLLSTDAPEADLEGGVAAGDQAQQEQGDDEAVPAAPSGEQAQQDETQENQGQQPEEGEAAGAASGGPSAAVIPQVPVDAILAACAQSPNSRVIDIVVVQGAITTE